MSKKTHRMDSKAQWRYLFATHRSFARRWAEATETSGGYHSLPGRRRAKTARSLFTGRAGR